MTTYTAFTTLTGREAAEKLGEALENLDPAPHGVGVFEIEDGSGLWEIGGYFDPDAPDGVALDLLAAASGAKPFVISALPDKDWVAEVRRELAPIEAGRFFLYGSHDADKVPAKKVALLIDAAMAFGTGHHGTTQGCLLAFDRLLEEGLAPKAVADIGCGTAVLAMAAAKVLDVPIIASDIDEVATETATANLAFNDLAGRVDVVTCAGFDDPSLTDGAPYDLIFANILKGPLIGLAPDMAEHAADGAYAILSGILNPQAEEVIVAYQAVGFETAHRLTLGDWTTLTLLKKA